MTEYPTFSYHYFIDDKLVSGWEWVNSYVPTLFRQGTSKTKMVLMWRFIANKHVRELIKAGKPVVRNNTKYEVRIMEDKSYETA